MQTLLASLARPLPEPTFAGYIMHRFRVGLAGEPCVEGHGPLAMHGEHYTAGGVCGRVRDESNGQEYEVTVTVVKKGE